MRIKPICLLFFLALCPHLARAQGAVPAFQFAAGQGSYTLLGRDPAQGGTTTIRTVLVPIALSFDAKKTAGKPLIMDAAQDVPRVLRSPVFAKFAFPSGGATQYVDAMLRSTFPKADGWHTLLGKPEVMPVKITVPVGYGYIAGPRVRPVAGDQTGIRKHGIIIQGLTGSSNGCGSVSKTVPGGSTPHVPA
jgi:hypothetical protein